MAEKTIALSAREVRLCQLWGQGLYGRTADGLLDQVGAVQLDTISVLARSHELVAYARLGPIGRPAVEKILWGGESFEYWAHAACVVALRDWPVFSFRRKRWIERLAEQDPLETAFKEVRARLKDGPMTANQLGGAKAGGPWWDWTDTKRAVERMLSTGEVVCMERKGFQRVYDLASRRIPDELLSVDLSPAECFRQLTERTCRHIGVGTIGDLTDYYRLKRKDVKDVIADTALVPVTVEGWSEQAWAHPDALRGISVPGRHVTTLLSPFDSLVWDRARTERVFGFYHRLEAYVPAPKRIHGYYAMPVLSSGRLVARVDPGRRDGALVAKRVVLESVGASAAAATAIKRAMRWVGATGVIVEEVVPDQARDRIVRALD